MIERRKIFIGALELAQVRQGDAVQTWAVGGLGGQGVDDFRLVRHDVEHLVGDRQPGLGPGWQVVRGPGDAFGLVEVEHGADERRAGGRVFLPGLRRPLGEFLGGPPFPVNDRGGALASADMAALALDLQEGQQDSETNRRATLAGVAAVQDVAKSPPDTLFSTCGPYRQSATRSFMLQSQEPLIS